VVAGHNINSREGLRECKEARLVRQLLSPHVGPSGSVVVVFSIFYFILANSYSS